MNLGSFTWPEVAELKDATLVIPVGSVEQHGPHLPLDTDTRIAVALAERASVDLANVLVAPALAYGASGEHEDFEGTVSAGTTATARLILELVRSAVPPFARVVVVNGHGGNAAALAWVQQRCGEEGRDVEAWTPRVEGGDAHAGHTETALMLAIDPSLVRLDRVEVGVTDPLADVASQLRSDGVRAVSPSGVLGDPTTAEADDGARLLDELAAELRTRLIRKHP